jgi:hypothetical protein
MEPDIFDAFVKGSRGEQDRLRKELLCYEIGPTRLYRGLKGEPLHDVTEERIAQIKADIARIERSVEFVAAQQEARPA